MSGWRLKHQISAADRSAYKQCRRHWDFSARHRRNLEPAGDERMFDFGRAMKDALAVYYFPGMWDWPRAIVLPLVHQGFTRSMREHRQRYVVGHEPTPVEQQDFETHLERGRQMLDDYFAWAPQVDLLCPVLVESDVEADIADPSNPESGLQSRDGQPVQYTAHVEVLAIDEYDGYWVLEHRIVDDWCDTEQLVLDERLVAACWAFEYAYPGLELAGTIHNELLALPDVGGRAAAVYAPPPEGSGEHERGGLRQHEGSGGGRSVPQHRRLDARARQPMDAERLQQWSGPGFRRTQVRRSRAEMAGFGRQLERESSEMSSADLAIYPSPSPENCRKCRYLAPCLVASGGGDPERLLASAYRARPPEVVREGRLGSGTWGMGRGAAPPWRDERGDSARG